MKARLDVLGRIKEARGRLRDLAAGMTAAADAEHERASVAHDDAASERDELLGSAPARLGAAQGIGEFFLLEAERAAAEAVLRARAAEVARAKAESDARRAALRDRAKALRVSEKVIEKVRTRLATDERKREQVVNDELSSARLTRMP